METSNEALNQCESNGQSVLFSSANETVTPLMTNINRTEACNQAQKQDDTNGHTNAFSSANETAPLMTPNINA